MCKQTWSKLQISNPRRKKTVQCTTLELPIFDPYAVTEPPENLKNLKTNQV